MKVHAWGLIDIV